jgi:RNA polymerase sigma factor for flagellar operon FliA
MSMQVRVAPEEARVFRRVAVTVDVEIFGGHATVIRAMSDNLSEGGIFVLSRETPRMQSRVSVVFSLPTEPDVRLRLDGIVRWLRPEASLPAGIGIEFISPDGADVDRIRAFVEQRDPMAWEDGPTDNASLPREVAIAFVPVIRRIAHAMAKMLPVRVDDLIGAGFLGLVEAHRTFRSSVGVSFDAYARLRIRGAMKDEARSADPLTRGQRSVAKQLRSARQSFTARTRREPSLQELAHEAGLTAAAVAEHQVLATAAQQQVSLDDDPDAAVDNEDSSPELPILRRQQQRSVEVALSALPPRLRDVLQMYYGESMTLRSIASVIGVSEARVSQLHSEAVRRLRESCAVAQ